MTEHTRLMRATERDDLLAYSLAWGLRGVAAGLVVMAFVLSTGCSSATDAVLKEDDALLSPAAVGDATSNEPARVRGWLDRVAQRNLDRDGSK